MKFITLFVIFSSIKYVSTSYETMIYSLSNTTHLPQSLSTNLENIDLSIVLPGNDNCFISVTNLVGVNIAPSTTPIILKQLVPINFHIERYWQSEGKKFTHYKYYTISNVPPHFASQVLRQGGINVTNVSVNCISKYYPVDKSEFCSKLKFLNFTSNIRPWNYELNVQLFPTEQSIKNLQHVYHVWFNAYRNSDYIPASLGKFRLLVIEDQVSWKVLHTFRGLLSGMGHYQETEILFAINYNLKLRSIKQDLVLFLPSTYSTNTLILPENFHLVGLQRLVKKVNKVFQIQGNFSVNWFTVLDDDLTKLFQRAILHHKKEKCKLDSSEEIPVPYLLIIRIIDILERVFGLKIKILDGRKSSRPAFIMDKFIGYDFDSVEFFLGFSPHRMRHIACGNTYFNSRSYYVLLASFDKYCWIFIIVFLLMYVPVAWNYLQDQASSKPKPNGFEVAFAILKNLLEQSTPFPEETFLKNNSIFRFLVLCLLFCILVLSNAYKNDNINVLISPIRFQPFESFGQIERNNFKVYAEFGYFWLLGRYRIIPNITELTKLFESAYHINNHSIVASNIKKTQVLMRYNSNLESFIQAFNKKNIKIPTHLEYFYNSSVLKINMLKDSSEQRILYETIQANLTVLQNEQSMSLLKKCNKTAVLAFEPNIYKYESRLMQQGLEKISVSKDVLLENGIGITLLGWFPDYILYRMRGMSQSGILDWWNELILVHLVHVRGWKVGFEESSEHGQTLSKERKGGLAGNIFVIFLVFLIGCLFALIVWIVELYGFQFAYWARRVQSMVKKCMHSMQGMQCSANAVPIKQTESCLVYNLIKKIGKNKLETQFLK